jgi:hypothetical protein
VDKLKNAHGVHVFLVCFAEVQSNNHDIEEGARYGTLEMIDKNGFPESQTSKARSSN